MVQTSSPEPSPGIPAVSAYPCHKDTEMMHQMVQTLVVNFVLYGNKIIGILPVSGNMNRCEHLEHLEPFRSLASPNT